MKWSGGTREDGGKRRWSERNTVLMYELLKIINAKKILKKESSQPRPWLGKYHHVPLKRSAQYRNGSQSVERKITGKLKNTYIL